MAWPFGRCLHLCECLCPLRCTSGLVGQIALSATGRDLWPITAGEKQSADGRVSSVVVQSAQCRRGLHLSALVRAQHRRKTASPKGTMPGV